MSYLNRWHSFLIAFSVATWLSQPLYSYVVTNDLFRETTARDILLFMLLYQGLPLAILVGLDRVVIALWGAGKLLRLIRGLMFAVAVLFFVRAADKDLDIPVLDALNSLPVAAMLVLLVGTFAAITAFLVKFDRPATPFFVYLSIVSVGLTALFIAQVGLTGKPWMDESTESSPPRVVPSSTEGPVFLIVFDGLSAEVLLKDERLDPSRFPNFAALGRDGAVFINATSNYIDTKVSIQSLMTGALFNDDGFGGSTGSMSETVGAISIFLNSGYSTEFFSTADNIIECGDGSWFLCQRAASSPVGKNVHLIARDFIIRFVPRKINLSARDFVLKFFPRNVTISIPFPSIHQYERPLWNNFLARVTRLESPGKVYFVHLTLPHHPYELDRDGNRVRTFAPGEGFEDLEKMARDYDEQVTFVDTLLGELTAKLKTEGLYSRSLIAVTADHDPRSLGLGQKYAGCRRHNYFPEEINEIIPRVPLIIHGPEIEPQVSAVDYQHIDFLPTVLDLLGLPLPPDLPGVSAFSANRPVRDKVFYGFPGPTTSTDQISYIYEESSQRWSKVKSVNSVGDTGRLINENSERAK